MLRSRSESGERSAEPDALAFDAWYRIEHPKLVASLFLITGDLSLAGESVDEACARALERWERVRRMESPTGWTFRVAANVSQRMVRRSALERRLLARTTTSEAVPAPAGEVWRLVSQLPKRQREVIVLRHIADLREVEVAEALGVSRSTVSTSLRAAYERLNRLMSDG